MRTGFLILLLVIGCSSAAQEPVKPQITTMGALELKIALDGLMESGAWINRPYVKERKKDGI